MSISYKEIRTERQWRAATGLTEEQFKKLTSLFSENYENLFGKLVENQEEIENRNLLMSSYEQLLFFGLFSLKSGLTYDLLALSFGLSPSNVYEKQSVFLRVLEVTLAKAALLPRRAFSNEEEFKQFIANQQALLIDATEQAVQRPENKEDQRDDYSGKKKDIR